MMKESAGDAIWLLYEVDGMMKESAGDAIWLLYEVDGMAIDDDGSGKELLGADGTGSAVEVDGTGASTGRLGNKSCAVVNSSGRVLKAADAMLAWASSSVTDCASLPW